MGGKQGKHSKSGLDGLVANKSGSKPEFNLNKLKDDYSQYIRRDQLRKEREHKKKVGDNKNIYN